MLPGFQKVGIKYEAEKQVCSVFRLPAVASLSSSGCLKIGINAGQFFYGRIVAQFVQITVCRVGFM